MTTLPAAPDVVSASVRTASRLLVLAAATAMLGCGPRPDEGPEPPPHGGVGTIVYRTAAPGVVRVDAGLRTGAGIVIGESEIITAAHVVRGAHEVVVHYHGSDTTSPARVVGYHEPQDLALLEVPSLPAGIEPMDLAPAPTGNSLPAPGSEIWTLGHPDGRDWSISRGVISHVESERGGFVGSIDAAPGSSGGPVLVYDPVSNSVEVVGLVTQVLGAGEVAPTAVVGASAIRSVLEELRGGAMVGYSDAQSFVESVTNRSPLAHQVVMARRVDVDGPGADEIAGLVDTFEFDAFPALQTLEVRATWRYFFTGTHTFRYRVVRVDDDGENTPIHEGPLRTFELPDARKSYVHKVEIDVELPEPGDYAVLVETHGRLSAVAPFVATRRGEALGAPPTWPFQVSPLQHVLVIASEVTGSALDDQSLASRAISAAVGGQDGATSPSDTTDDAAREGGQGSDTATPDVTGGESITIRGTFNTIRLAEFPTSVQFDTWTRWAASFQGEHSFFLEIVDATGRSVARGHEGRFTLESSRDAHEHIARWDVEFTSPGLYFVLVTTDGSISSAMPIWVQEER